MFTFMVSSLNYALRCSVVSVPGLIWMFEKRSEGWKKRSQTGNSLLLMSSQKRLLFFLPRIHHKALCMTSDLVCAECGLKRGIFEALAKPLRAKLKRLLQVKWAPRAETCVCVFTLSRPSQCVFKHPREWRELTKKAPNGKIQVRISRHGAVVLNGTYIKTLTLTKTTSSAMIDNKSEVGNWRKRETGPKILSVGHLRTRYTQWYANFLLLFFMIIWPSRTGTTQDWYLSWDLPLPRRVLHPNDL